MEKRLTISLDLLTRTDEADPTCLSTPSRLRIVNTRKARAATEVKKYAANPTMPNPQPLFVVSHETGKPLEDLGPRYVKVEPASYKPSVRRIGVPIEYNIEELSPSVRAAWIRTLFHLESRGHEIVRISLPNTKHALSAYYVLAPAEASSNLAKYDGIRYGIRPEDGTADGVDGGLFNNTRGENLGAEVQRRILLGAYSLSAGAIDNYFIKAQKVRRLVQKDFDSVFKMRNPLRDKSKMRAKGVDYIICPTAPTTPPTMDSLKQSTPFDSYMNDVFTVPASLAGLPALSVPAPRSSSSIDPEENLIGMQIIGQYGDDYSVIRFAMSEMDFIDDVIERRLGVMGKEPIIR